ncbi:uncharacterized protein PFL1_05750 [Pseudozyma flocculosa PF-1]|uniref:ferroxidase n=2 Tax=Pseudozyma flocculosa TaxID=84751 RepID=A0A5C3F8W4_9BASI|nr:uncharacterized protein PFL1_05750 [Pseudozyma flocculosa PF-1]EPQ26771.1 hypothetical protein PFL1_05750 [Pseudozyma flocculosa PF-1]SPO40903.1 related to YFH1 - mitochondrial matrix iron chaperone [Pseudozyma flocculosa]
MSTSLSSPLPRRVKPSPRPLSLDAPRCFSNSANRRNAPNYTISNLDERTYHALSNGVLDSLTEHFEALIEESDIDALEQRAARDKLGPQRGAPTTEWDVECATGVMNLRLGPYGTYVINKQPPNKQIWLSSPTSGPKRFDYDESHRAWFSLKEGQLVTLKELLDSELSRVFDTAVDVDLDPHP